MLDSVILLLKPYNLFSVQRFPHSVGLPQSQNWRREAQNQISLSEVFSDSVVAKWKLWSSLLLTLVPKFANNLFFYSNE